MSDEKKPIVSIVMLCKGRPAIDLGRLQAACASAFRGTPEPPKVVPIKNASVFGIALGPMRLGVIISEKPYVADAGKVGQQQSNFPLRLAFLDHRAWMSIDVIGQSPASPDRTYAILGVLAAELLDDNVLALIRQPDGAMTAYDFSFIPKLRQGKVADVFKVGAPDRLTMVRSNDRQSAIDAATAEARRHWPDFVAAFNAMRRGQNFAIKRKFIDGGKNEHMWVQVLRFRGDTIVGQLANEPQIIKSLKMGKRLNFPSPMSKIGCTLMVRRSSGNSMLRC